MPRQMNGHFPWSDAALAMLRALYDEGWSASFIADKLRARFGREISRNAVIGKLNRLGLKRKGPSDPTKSKAPYAKPPDPGKGKKKPRRAKGSNPEAQAAKERVAEMRARIAGDTQEQPPRPSPKPKPVKRPPARKPRPAPPPKRARPGAPFSILELQAGECRFGVEERGGEHLFCGAPVAPGKSYCAEHYARTVITVRERAHALTCPPPAGCPSYAWDRAMQRYAHGGDAQSAAAVVQAASFPMTAKSLAQRVFQHAKRLNAAYR